MYLAICRVFNFFRLFKIVVVYLAIFVVYLAKPFVWFIRMFHELAIARLLYRDNEVVYVNRILTISQPKIINYLKPSSNNVTQQLTVTRRLTITTIIENGHQSLHKYYATRNYEPRETTMHAHIECMRWEFTVCQWTDQMRKFDWRFSHICEKMQLPNLGRTIFRS